MSCIGSRPLVDTIVSQICRRENDDLDNVSAETYSSPSKVIDFPWNPLGISLSLRPSFGQKGFVTGLTEAYP